VGSFFRLELPDECFFLGFGVDLYQHASAAGVFEDELSGGVGGVRDVCYFLGLHWCSKFNGLGGLQRGVEMSAFVCMFLLLLIRLLIKRVC